MKYCKKVLARLAAASTFVLFAASQCCAGEKVPVPEDAGLSVRDVFPGREIGVCHDVFHFAFTVTRTTSFVERLTLKVVFPSAEV